MAISRQNRQLYLATTLLTSGFITSGAPVFFMNQPAIFSKDIDGINLVTSVVLVIKTSLWREKGADVHEMTDVSMSVQSVVYIYYILYTIYSIYIYTKKNTIGYYWIPI